MTRQRVPRTRAGGLWTEAQFWGRLRSALRKQWLMWPPRGEALRRAAVVRGSKRCAACGGAFPSKEVEVDHVEPCGPLRDYDDAPGFLRRLFCEVEGLRVLCKKCHKERT